MNLCNKDNRWNIKFVVAMCGHCGKKEIVDFNAIKHKHVQGWCPKCEDCNNYCRGLAHYEESVEEDD